MAASSRKRFSSPLLIGSFIIIGSIIMIAFIIWLGSNQFLRENVLYVTYFSGSVEGLQTGSPVKYQGVPVGTIKNIEVAPDGKLVEVVMQIEKDVVINDSIRVKSEMSGIAGGRFLQMYYPDNSEIAKAYPQLSFKPKYTVIKSTPSGIQEIETAMGDVLDKLRQIKFYEISSETIKFLEETSKFFSNKELYDIVSKIDSSANRIDNLLKNVDTSDIIDNFQLTSQKLLQVSVELEYFTNNLNNQIEKIQLASKVDTMFAQIDSVMFQAKTIVNVLGFRTETILFGINEAVEEAKSSSRQFRKTLKTWSDNPSNVFLSNPPPPEK